LNDAIHSHFKKVLILIKNYCKIHEVYLLVIQYVATASTLGFSILYKEASLFCMPKDCEWLRSNWNCN